MATLTIRNVPQTVVRKLRALAVGNGKSMEQEVRDLLARRFARRSEVVSRIRARWASLPEPTVAEVTKWRAEGRRGHKR